MSGNIESMITALYDMIQDARAVPLASDKCMVERDRALDMLDELSTQMPAEFKQAQTIVQSKEELVSQARREAETIIRNARAQADEMAKQENIYQEAKRQCEQMVLETQNRIESMKRVSAEYVDNSLAQADDAVLRALNELRETRIRFQAASGLNKPQAAVQQDAGSFDQDLD